MDNILEINNIKYGFWACQRPLTKKWGSGQIFNKLTELMGKPDVAFGKTDNISDNIFLLIKTMIMTGQNYHSKIINLDLVIGIRLMIIFIKKKE